MASVALSRAWLEKPARASLEKPARKKKKPDSSESMASGDAAPDTIEYILSNFRPNFEGLVSRLYRRRFLQVNTRWKVLAEIYTMHSFAPFSNLNFFVKNRQNFFAIELMNIH